VDVAPAEIVATLLDEGTYLCSARTMYRLLTQADEVRERRAVARHRQYAAPELVARSAIVRPTDAPGSCKYDRGPPRRRADEGSQSTGDVSAAAVGIAPASSRESRAPLGPRRVVRVPPDGQSHLPAPGSAGRQGPIEACPRPAQNCPR